MPASVTFTPAVSPSIRSGNKQTNFRILTNNFGDGYEQRVVDGINNITIEVKNLTFQGLTETQADDIETFLRARNGVEAFNYTLPDESSSRQFVVDKGFKRKYLGGGLYDMVFDIREVFDI